MSKFDEIALQMEKNAIVKCVIGNYIVYRKDYLQDNLEKEIILQKSASEFARKFKGLKNKYITDIPTSRRKEVSRYSSQDYKGE